MIKYECDQCGKQVRPDSAITLAGPTGSEEFGFAANREMHFCPDLCFWRYILSNDKYGAIKKIQSGQL